MGKNQSASNLTNIIKQDANGSISFMSGSTMLMALSNTGQMSGSAPAMSAVTASYADNFTVKGTLTAQTIVSQVVTSSTSLITGSTIFGTLIANTHQFTGSLLVSGSNINITSTGVGINTTPSGYRLNVAGQAAVSNILVGSGYRVEFADAGSTSWAWLEGSSYDRGYSFISFNTSGSEKMRLTSAGNLGIGIINPSFPLEVSSSTTGLLGRFTSNQNEAQIRLVNTSTGGRSYSIGSGGNSSGGAKGFYVYDETGGATVFAISGSGNVGIGISNPSYKLHVNGTSGFENNIDIGNANISWGYSGKGIYLSRAGLGPRESLIGRDATSSWWIDIGGSSDWSGVTLARNGGAVVIGASTIAYSNYKLLARVANDRNVAIGNQGTDCSIEAYNDAVSVNVPLRIYGNNIMLLGGNVGVGKTSISTKLDVGGSLNVDARFIQAGVSRVCYAGTVNGNQSLSFSLVVGSQSAVKITAAMNHYGYISGYGCARMSFVGSTPAFSEINISDTTSGNGGAWSFSNGGSGIITISKSAGSYGGGGYYFIEVVGNDPQSIS